MRTDRSVVPPRGVVDETQRLPSGAMPPPGTIMWTCGWCVIAEPHQAGRTSTASQRRSNGRAIAPRRQCDICGRQLISAMSWPSTALGDIDLAAFSEHLRTCRCPRAEGGRRNHHTIFGARLFRQHLVDIGVCRPAAAATEPAEPQLVAQLQSVAAQASRGGRSHHQALRSRCRPLDDGAWGGSDWLGAGRCSQLLLGPREQLREWNRREVDDQPASVLAVPRRRRPLPGRSRRPSFLPTPIGGLPTCRGICRRSR